ncbi:hypothetical protein R6Q57_002163 [Mikania cordata]
MVPPANSTPAYVPVNSLQEIENKEGNDKLEGNDKNTPVPNKGDSENKDKLDENDKNTPESEKENLGHKDNAVGNDTSTPTVEKEKYDYKEKVADNDENTVRAKVGNVEKKENLVESDENTPAAGSVNSFQQLSSSQNEFRGLMGMGFSTSSFSFGFGTNGNTSLFGNMDKKTEGTKITPVFKQDVQVETGEENEKTVFMANSVLFEFIDGSWKERGKGELKVNVLTSETRKARLVMRASGNYRLILNASVFPDMKLTKMEKKGITFACMNSTGEGQNGLATFALKFKDALLFDEFSSVVMAHKGNLYLTAPIDLKTPENSPKTIEE